MNIKKEMQGVEVVMAGVRRRGKEYTLLQS
jgi:hypothetical protein